MDMFAAAQARAKREAMGDLRLDRHLGGLVWVCVGEEGPVGVMFRRG